MDDVAIIGGGIIGLATGNAILERNPKLKVVILEKESKIGQHQTGHNSGVIHSGIYYKPGSLKAKTCRQGISLLMEFCRNNHINYDMCGKVIIATSQDQLSALNALYDRGIGNGINGLKKLSLDELKEIEPHADGISALYCPETGIVDYSQVCKKLSENFQIKGGEIITDLEIVSINSKIDGITIIEKGAEFKIKFLINCAGLFSDFIAELSGVQRQVRIVPFRGEYYMLKKEAQSLVKKLIYPVPDPRYPFLGVHFTRTIDGRVEAGPNAVLALAREGYKKTDINFPEIWDFLSFPGFWKMARKYWPTAISEHYRSFSKRAFVKALQELVPDISKDDIYQCPSGVRAQALDKDGALVDDFVIENIGNMIHVINAPSPAATSSLAIGDYIANIYFEKN